jgi:dolichol-phosphate mannosyltransferase
MSSKVAVVIPAYKVSQFILDVIKDIGSEVDFIVVVDDSCPENSGTMVLKESNDSRLSVIFHQQNMGVGGAVKTGYIAALEKGANVIVKLDGDGQMNPALITELIEPIQNGFADYAKGNRFYDLRSIKSMPKIRIFGNLGLTFLTKLSSGYWDVFDPTNGFTAISDKALGTLDFTKIDDRYFFESDILFHLGMAKNVVIDVPMTAKYGEEKSNLKVGRSIVSFSFKHAKNTAARIFYNYFIRDFTIASLQLLVGFFFSVIGLLVGLQTWIHSFQTNESSEPGTIILVAILILTGFQMLLGFISYDMASNPSKRRFRKFES